MARRIALPLTIVLILSSLGTVTVFGQAQPADSGTRALDLSGYHNYTQVRDWLGAVADAHPDIASVSSLGTTYEGREILALRLTDAPDSEEADEPDVLIMGGHHGNELPSVEVPLYIIEHLAGNYSTDYTVKGLVDSRDIWFVPLVNPDGREYSLTVDEGWRKNRRPVDLDGDGNVEGWGVDPNRNYGHHWGEQGTSNDPTSRIYCGPHEFSESETQAIRALALDQVFDLSLSYHTYGRQVSFTWNNGIDLVNPRGDTLEAIATEMAERNGYTPMEGKDLYLTTGDSDDWLYANTSCLPFTVEVGTEYQPPAWQLQSLCQENLASALYAIDIAGEPERSLLPDWTVMVHMASDANSELALEAFADLNEMEVAGSSENVNIIVLYDGMTYGDSKLYRIKWDSAGMNSAIISDILDDGGDIIDPVTGEADMSDPSTLHNFVEWTLVNSPAQHYLLDIWGHGKDILEGCCLDGFDLMPLDGLGDALSGFGLDIVSFDACLMGHFETAHELLGTAELFVGSETMEPVDGWNYQSTFSSLVGAPNSMPKEVTGWIVSDYLASNILYGYVTMAAMDMGVFEHEFLPALNDFVSVAVDFMNQDLDLIWEARNLTDTFTVDQDTVDLYEFLGNLVGPEVSDALNRSASALLALKERLIIGSGHGAAFPDADTLGIYFPPSSSEPSTGYLDLSFADELWDEFLAFLRDPVQRPNLLPHQPPAMDNTAGPYIFEVDVTGQADASVSLVYRINGGQWQVKAMDQANGSYQCQVAGQENGTVIDFYFQCEFDGWVVTDPYGVNRGSEDYYHVQVFAKCDVMLSGVITSPGNQVESGTQAIVSVNCTNSGAEDAMVNVSLELTEAGGDVVCDYCLLTLPAGETVPVHFTWTAVQGDWSGTVRIISLEVFDPDAYNQSAYLYLSVRKASAENQVVSDDLMLILAVLLLVGMIPPIAFALLHKRVRRRKRQIARKALAGARDHIRTVEEFGVEVPNSYRILARAESAYARGALGEAVELCRTAKESATLALGAGRRGP